MVQSPWSCLFSHKSTVDKTAFRQNDLQHNGTINLLYNHRERSPWLNIMIILNIILLSASLGHPLNKYCVLNLMYFLYDIMELDVILSEHRKQQSIKAQWLPLHPLLLVVVVVVVSDHKLISFHHLLGILSMCEWKFRSFLWWYQCKCPVE